MSLVKRLPANVGGRDFIVGDVHGCTEALHALLCQVEFDTTVDRLFSVGDLIDRGPDSGGALTLLDCAWFHSVRGNHEEMLLTVVNEPTARHWDWWVQNGGAWARGADATELRLLADRFDELPLAIVVGEGAERFNVMHAEFFGGDADLDAEDFEPHIAMRMLWGRDIINRKAAPRAGTNLSTTYVGHTPVQSPVLMHSHHYIDTGAGHAIEDARLTLIQHGMGTAGSLRTWRAPASSLKW